MAPKWHLHRHFSVQTAIEQTCTLSPKLLSLEFFSMAILQSEWPSTELEWTTQWEPLGRSFFPPAPLDQHNCFCFPALVPKLNCPTLASHWWPIYLLAIICTTTVTPFFTLMLPINHAPMIESIWLCKICTTITSTVVVPWRCSPMQPPTWWPVKIMTTAFPT